MPHKYTYVNDYPSKAWMTVFEDGHAIVDLTWGGVRWFPNECEAETFLRNRGFYRA